MTDATPQAALLSDGEIIAIRKSAKPTDPAKAWGDTIALARGIEAAILAKLQSTQELVQSIPPGLRVGDSHMESLIEAAIQGHAGTRDAMRWLVRQIAKVDAEPVQAGELPPLPHDGWPARFRCDSCDGNREIGELISMGHFQPPERQTCPDCGGRGWSDEGPAFNADHMRYYARAALSARKPLTEEQRAEVFRAAESRMVHTINLSWRNAVVDEVERAHGIGLEVKP